MTGTSRRLVRALSKVQVLETGEQPTVKDDNETFRTHLVSASNAILALAVQNFGGWLNVNGPIHHR